MATSPIGSPRAGAPEAAIPPEGPGAHGPRQRSAHSGPPQTRNALPGPPPPRRKLVAGSSAAKSPTTKTSRIQALQQLERAFDELPPRPADLAGMASERATTHTLTDLALRIAQQRAELPRDDAIRAISDTKFVKILARAAMWKQSVMHAATVAYNKATKPVQEQMGLNETAFEKHVATHENSAGKARLVSWVVGLDRAGRVAAQAQELAKLNHGVQQEYKEHIALCEATLRVHWKLDPVQVRDLEGELLSTRLKRLTALSQQVHHHCELLLWACVNPHPYVFAGMEIEELLPVVEKLSTYNLLAIVKRVDASVASLGPDLWSTEDKEATNDIRIAAADCAAYMASLADRVEAGSGKTITGQSDRTIRDQAIEHLRNLEETGWELAGMAGTLLQPPQQQAIEPSGSRTPATPAKPRPRQKARGKEKPSATREPMRQAAPAGPATGPSEEAAPAVRPPGDARQPMAAKPLPPAPSARAARALVSQLTARLEEAQDPRQAHRRELQQLRKVGTPEKVVSTMQAHARQWEIRADKILAAHENLDSRHLLQLSADELKQAYSLKERAADIAAELQGEAKALTRDLDQVKCDLMKTYLLPAQTHWEELLDSGQVQAVSLPKVLPSSAPNTLFEVALQPAPLAGQDIPPPPVWLHLHTHQAADAARLGALPPAAFAAMHLKSNEDRRRGKDWLAEQANRGLPAEKIHRAKVNKRFVDKVLAEGREMQSTAPG